MPEHPASGASELDFFRFPAAALEERRAHALERGSGRVCIVGAGIAGLVVAYELLRAGYSVVLADRDRRVGGRIRTWRTEGVFGEFGPMRIPPAHGGTMHYVEEFGLSQSAFVQHNQDGWLHLRGEKRRISDWAGLLPLFGGDPRLLFGGMGLHKTDLDPEAILQLVIDEAKATMGTGELWSAMNGELGPAARILASTSYWQLAEGMLRDPARWASLGSTLPPPRRFSNLGWEFIGRATGALWEERISALEACIEDLWVRGSPRKRLEDGMESLPEALEGAISSLGGRIDLDTRVTAIVSEPAEDRVRVFAGDEELSGDGDPFNYVVCTVPASATAQIDFEPTLSPRKYEALSSLTYFSAAKSLVLVSERRWELQPDLIFGGASFTDLPIQQCWYPADNASPDPEEPLRATLTDDLRGDIDTTPRRFVAIDAERSRSPAILTAAYMTGVNAERFTSMGGGERDAQVRRCLEQLHPGISADVIDIQHWCWSGERSPGGGAWTYLAPGAHERYQDALCEPHPAAAPRVFFAGEHLCVLHGWMQSAIQSSLEATMALLELS